MLPFSVPKGSSSLSFLLMISLMDESECLIVNSRACTDIYYVYRCAQDKPAPTTITLLSSEAPVNMDEIDKGEIAAKDAALPALFKKDHLEILFFNDNPLVWTYNKLVLNIRIC